MISSLNPLYAYDAVIDQMAISFKQLKPNHLLLNDFLIKQSYRTFFDSLLKAGGSQVFIPDRYSYTLLDMPKEVDSFFHSANFLSLLQDVCGVKTKDVKIEARKFKHKDFTLLHDAENLKQGLGFSLFFSDLWKSQCGGSLIYSRGESDPLIFPVKGNSFVLVKTTRDVLPFVKYINHFAGESSFIQIWGMVV